MRIAQGHPIVCLAQTENWWETHVATRPEIADLPQLNGKRIATAPLLTDGKFCGHASGNRILVLELNGVDPAKVRYVTEKGSKTELVRTGKADACFVAPERSEEAIAAGLRIHRLAPLAMVHSVTFTSTVPRIAREDGLAGRVIRVLLAATHFLKTRKDETVELWRKPVASFRPGQYERLVASYEDMVHEYESTLYPRAESILNAHRLASMVYPGATDANPMCLWDLRPLHEVHRSGFLRSLGEPVLAGSA